MLKFISLKSEELWVAVIALLLALLLAAHQNVQYERFGVVGTYLYWVVRILIESAFFFTFLLAIEKYLKQLLPGWAHYLLAVLLSLVPFTLAITALDLIVGLPELGFNGDTTVSDAKGVAFGLELIYLLDNHFFLGALLLLPRWLLFAFNTNTANDFAPASVADDFSVSAVQESVGGEPENAGSSSSTLSFTESLDPPLDGHICSIEAQEHYIRIVTTQESRMILHRFSDAVREMPPTLGMRVHRSHWVAHSVVQEVVTEGQSMKLRLTDNKMVPVSRTFRAAVAERYANTAHEAK